VIINIQTYVMKVWRGDDVNNSWRVDRKYSEFSTLYSLAKVQTGPLW